jgi:hypothetical protein
MGCGEGAENGIEVDGTKHGKSEGEGRLYERVNKEKSLEYSNSQLFM